MNDAGVLPRVERTSSPPRCPAPSRVLSGPDRA